jgi:hypothetical protein
MKVHSQNVGLRAAMVALVGSVLTLSSTPASAAPLPTVLPLELSGVSGLLIDLPGDLVSWTKNVTTGLFPPTALVPGQAVESVVGVGNHTDEPMTLSLKADSIRDNGQLGAQLRFTITRDPEQDGTFEPEPLFSGTLQQLGDGTPLADIVLPASSAWDYRVEASIPEDAGNEIMGDSVSFDLVWKSTGDSGTETLVVPAAGGGNDGQVVTSPPEDPGTKILGIQVDALPVTGAGLRLLLSSLGLASLGVLLRVGSRRGRRGKPRS